MQPSVHPTLAGGFAGPDALEGLPSEPAFSRQEYQRRVGRVRAEMEASGVDVLLVFSPPNVFYLSGFQSFSMYNSECVILPLQGDPLLVVHPPEVGGALLHSWLEGVHGYAEGREREAYIAELLTDSGFAGSRIGVETASRALPVQFHDGLKASLPGAKFVDGSDLVPSVKAIKSEEEIEHLRRSGAMTTAGMAAAIDAIEAGAADNDVAAAYRALVEAGSEYMCTDPIVTSGRRSSILHSTHKRVPIQSGDTLLLEMGACVQRYSAPIMRAASVGEPADEVRAVADACLAALDNVLSTVKAGVTGHDVATAGWEALRRAGDDIVFHGVFGYAVGAGFPPSWADDTGVMLLGEHAPLRTGQVFHHPVAVRKLGKFGVAFSETSVVTDDGCEVFTSAPRELFIR